MSAGIGLRFFHTAAGALAAAEASAIANVSGNGAARSTHRLLVFLCEVVVGKTKETSLADRRKRPFARLEPWFHSQTVGPLIGKAASDQEPSLQAAIDVLENAVVRIGSACESSPKCNP